MSIFDREDFDLILRAALTGEHEEIPPMRLVEDNNNLQEMSEAA